MAVLDYFMVSPGDKKRANLETENKRKLMQEDAKLRKSTAIDLRDSNQLNEEFTRHKAERDMQESIANTMEAGGGQPIKHEAFGFGESGASDFSPEQNHSLSMVAARAKMDQNRAESMLSPMSTAINARMENEANRPYIGARAASGNEATLAGNSAAKQKSYLEEVRDRARQQLAGNVVKSQDAAEIAQNQLAGQRAGMMSTAIPQESAAYRSGLGEQEAQARFNAAEIGGRDVSDATGAKNSGYRATTAMNNEQANNPGAMRQFYHQQVPAQLQMMREILGTEGGNPLPNTGRSTAINGPPTNVAAPPSNKWRSTGIKLGQ